MRAALALAGLVAATPAHAACPDVPTVARFAMALLERRVPAPLPAMDEAEARCAQARLVATLAQPWGDVVGHALAAEAMPPLRGALFFATTRAATGATIEAGYAARPAVAPGLLLRMGEDGRIAAASAYLALLDLAAVPAPGRAARIAGNLGLRLGVVGPEVAVADPAGLAGAAVLQADGSVLASLPGLGLAAPPAALVAALAREMAAEGRALRPGEHVALLGAAIPVPPRAGEDWRLSVAGLGVVGVVFR
jgi:2-keto-4-pentenoate hydratase